MLRKLCTARGSRYMRQRGGVLLVVGIALLVLGLATPWSPASTAAEVAQGALIGVSLGLNSVALVLLGWSLVRKQM